MRTANNFSSRGQTSRSNMPNVFNLYLYNQLRYITIKNASESD